MSKSSGSRIAGVFSNEANAQQAMADLQQAGCSKDQILYSVHKGGAGISDSLKEIGFGQDEATYYDREFLAGRTIVTVLNTDHEQEAASILKRNGASDFNNQTQQTAATTADGDQNLQLHAEQLSATKDRVQTGEVRLHKDVVSEEQTIDVPVTHEEVYIERRPGSGEVSDRSIGEEETIRVPVSADQVNVSKQTVQTGEVALGKRQVQETKRVSDTVRHEEAHIERQGDVNIQGDNSDTRGQ